MIVYIHFTKFHLSLIIQKPTLFHRFGAIRSAKFIPNGIDISERIVYNDLDAWIQICKSVIFYKFDMKLRYIILVSSYIKKETAK